MTEAAGFQINERVRFERNTIRQAVCELRFPTLPDIANDAPRDFVKKIRHAFPHYEPGVGIKLSFTDRGMEQVPEPTHRYISADRTCTIFLRSASIGIETGQYVDLETFLERLSHVLEAARLSLDTDFFTRVGLRYINVLPAKIGDLPGWVNEDLVGPLRNGPFVEAEHYWCELRGNTDVGTYAFKVGSADVEGAGRRYVIDADYAQESVDWDNALDCIRHLNRINFERYIWAIGPKTRDYLGTATKKDQ